MKRREQFSMTRKIWGFIFDSITLASITIILIFALAVCVNPAISAHLVSLTVAAFATCITSGSAKIILNTEGKAA